MQGHDWMTHHSPHPFWTRYSLSFQILSLPFSALLCAPGPWQLWTTPTGLPAFWLPQGLATGSLWGEIRGERVWVLPRLAAVLWSCGCQWLSSCGETTAPIL